MDIITKLAEGFMRLLQAGVETFISWMTGIVPVVLMLMVAMSTLTAFLGEDRVVKVAKLSAKNPLTRYLVLPFLSAFMLGNPMSLTMACFLPEYYKPSCYAVQTQLRYTSNGVSPHINPGELFIWMRIAQGIETLGLNSMELVIRYLFVGLLMNFIGGWITDLTTGSICRQQGIVPSKEAELSID